MERDSVPMSGKLQEAVRGNGRVTEGEGDCMSERDEMKR